MRTGPFLASPHIPHRDVPRVVPGWIASRTFAFRIRFSGGKIFHHASNFSLPAKPWL
jgi:hypothetical protein